MTWNDPFETLVESTVVAIGLFLQQKDTLGVAEIVRTQEVCRDFCNFICKDVHKATQQDYAVYMQLHAFTPEEERAYVAWLGHIREYVRATAENMPGNAQMHASDGGRQRTSSISQSERRHMRDRRSTRTIDPNCIDELMMNVVESRPENSGSMDTREQTAVRRTSEKASEAVQNLPLRKTEKTIGGQKTRPADSKFRRNSDNSTKPGFIRSDHTPLSVEKMSDTHPVGRRVKPADDVPTSENEIFAIVRENGRGGISDLGPLGIDPNESFVIPMIADAIRTAPKSEESPTGMDEPGELPELTGLTRSVDSVEYDFSSSNILKMREFERQNVKSAQPEDPGNDPEQSGSFRPYIFDSRYLVDLPVPQTDVLPVKVGLLNRFIIPFAPATVILALAALLLTLYIPAGIGCMVLACISIAVALPDVMPPHQQTPQAAVMSYLNARHGRCYSRAQSLLAMTSDEACSLDLDAVWTPPVSWPVAIKNRFRPASVSETRVAASSARKDALVLIYVLGDIYYLAPMVRKNGLWYLTGPQLPPHRIVENEKIENW